MWFALQSHTGEVFVLEAHPTDPRILMSAGVLCSGGCFSQKESIVTVCVCVSCRARWFGHTLGHSGRTEIEDATVGGV